MIRLIKSVIDIMQYLFLCLSFLLLAGCSGDQQTSQPVSSEMEAAKSKALALCSGCHGPTGISTSGRIPNLAGRNKEYIVEQLLDFRSGQRPSHLPMTHIARMLSKQEVELISVWYSEQSGR